MSSPQNHLQAFVTAANASITEWSSAKNNFTATSKTLSENKTSLETLQKNLGTDHPAIQTLQEIIAKDASSFESTFLHYNALQTTLQDTSTTCLTMMRDLLHLYEHLQQVIKPDPSSTPEDSLPQDPEPVQIAKLLHSTIDNHQLRADPPIANVHKNDYRAFAQPFMPSPAPSPSNVNIV